MTIIKLNVCMRTTSRTLEESLIFSDMTLNYVRIGKVAHSSHVMKKVARGCKLALSVMAGKNNSFIRSFTKLCLAKKRNASKDLNVLFIIVLKIKGLTFLKISLIMKLFLFAKKET